MKTKYEEAALSYIHQQKQLGLTSFRNTEGKPASWGDYLWSIVKHETKKTWNFFFIDPLIVERANPKTKYSESLILHGNASDLARCYTLDLIAQQGLKKDTIRKQLAARELLSWLNGDIWTLTQESLDDWMSKAADHKYPLVRPFISYCQLKGFIPNNIRFHYKYKRDTGFEAAIEKQSEKMPDEQLILALASIFHTNVPKVGGVINYKENVRECFVSCMTTLALSSPNRLVAEQIVLSKQELKSKKVKVQKKEGEEIIKDADGNPIFEEKIIHWLDWQGSKGYKDNRNHILASMAPSVERVMHYLNMVSEPARILCRYYANPNAKLKDLLFKFKPENLHGLSLDGPVNLFQLGGLLGFYDGINLSKLRLKDFPYGSDIKQEVTWNMSNFNLLFGTSSLLNRKYLPFKEQEKTITLAEIEKHWIKHIKKNVPAFPYRHQGDAASKVKVEQALSVFTGKQIATIGKGQSGAYKQSSSHFAIESIDLGGVIKKELKEGGIFQKNGFSDKFTINPHQLRHYINTVLQDSDLPEIVIAMVSGRLNVASNAVYDHTSDSAKVARIAYIRTSNVDAEKEIKVISCEEYEQATGKVAHKMSTGICTQQLHQTPCTYLNDFLTQCVGCRSSCHVNRDLDSIKLLEQDLEIQQYRLDEIKNNPSLMTNPIRQSWFITHHRNVFVLKELIKLMKSHDIKKGSLIRYAGDESVFHLIDIQKRERVAHKVALPDSQKALEELLGDFNTNRDTKPSEGINNLLESFGVSI
ncbi:MAG: hypothetical protein ACPGR2_01945 [Psychrobium sp.]